MIAKSIEVDRHLEKVTDDDRPSAATGLEMARVAVEQLLIDPREIDGAEFAADELEEATRSVEYLPNTDRRELLAMTREIDVEPGIEQFPDCFAGTDIFDRAEMYGDMATAGVLAKYRRPEIPACIAIAGQAAPIEALLQRRGSKNRTVMQILWSGARATLLMAAPRAEDREIVGWPRCALGRSNVQRRRAEPVV